MSAPVVTPRDSTVPATLALTGLTAVVALGLGRLFEDWSFLPPVLLAGGAGHVVSYWARRARVPVLLAGILTLGAVALVTAWTILPGTTAYGMPTGATLAGARDALADARATFDDVVAPAAVHDGFVLASALAIGLTAFLADWAAFRAGASVEALIPGFTIFVFTSALATGRYRELAVASFVAGCLAFVVARRVDVEAPTGVWFGGTASAGRSAIVRGAAVLGAVALVLGLIVGPSIPGADANPLVPYKGVGDEGPTRRATTSPLVDIRGRLVEHSGTEVFAVRSNEPLYWRLTSLNEFNGTIWKSEDSYRDAEGTLEPSFPIARSVPSRTVLQEFTIGPLASIWAPAAYRPVNVVEGLEEATYSRDSGGIITPAETTDGMSYVVESVVPALSPDLLANAPARAPRDIAERYLELPEISPRVIAEAHRIVAGADTPYDRARALQDHFQQNYRYSLEIEPGHGRNALENFLFNTRTGYCEQFSAAYAVLSRIVNLPTRVAVGFTQGILGEDGLYHVLDEHAHAWPEVYLHGFGWVAFEPTPGRGAPGAESYTGLPEQQEQVETTIPEQPTTPTTVPQAAPPTTAVPPIPFEDPASTAPPEEPWTENRVIRALALIALLALLWCTVVPALNYARRRRRWAGADTAGAHVLAAWGDVQEALARAGARRRPAETYREHALRATRLVGLPEDAGAALRSLSVDAAAATYSDGVLSDAVSVRAEADAQLVLRRLAESTSWAERALAWIDPRPIARDFTESRETRTTERAERAAA